MFGKKVKATSCLAERPVLVTAQRVLHFISWQTCGIQHQLDFSGKHSAMLQFTALNLFVNTLYLPLPVPIYSFQLLDELEQRRAIRLPKLQSDNNMTRSPVFRLRVLTTWRSHHCATSPHGTNQLFHTQPTSCNQNYPTRQVQHTHRLGHSQTLSAVGHTCMCQIGRTPEQDSYIDWR